MIDNLIHSMLVCPSYETTYPSVVRAEGVYLYDSNGKRYIDSTSGTAAVSNLGHSIEGLSEVVKKQMDSFSLIPTHTFTCEQTENYLKKLVGFASHDFAKAWTASSGTEAVEQALKLALQYQQLLGQKERCKIISRWGTYHGNSVFTLDVGGMKLRRGAYDKWMHNFPHIPPSYSYRRPLGMSEEEYALQSAGEFEKAVLIEGPETVAAFIAEPMVAAALGAVPPSKGYFNEIRRVCDKYGILFIADEVLTSFGRIGANFGMERFGVTPDIIATGKGISGGAYPLSAVIINEKVANIFEKNSIPFLGGHSYSCNPVGSVIGNFVIDYTVQNKIVENSYEMGNVLMKKLQRLYEYDIVGDVRGLGLYVGVEFVRDKDTKEPFDKNLNISQKIVDFAFERGIVLYKGKGSVDGESGDHVVICPPLVIDESQLEEIVSVLESAVKGVMEKEGMIRVA